MKPLKDYLRENPEVLENYIKYGTIAARVITVPLTKLMKHLLEVQGIDPKTEPGALQRKAFQQALDDAFGGFELSSYDKNFDFSVIHKSFNENRQILENLGVDEKRFNSLTDLNNLQSPAPPVAPTIIRSPVQELSDLFNEKPADQSLSEPTETVREVNRSTDVFLSSMKELLRKMRDETAPHPLEKDEFADLILDVEKERQEEVKDIDPKELFAKTHALKNVKSAIEKSGSSEQTYNAKKKTTKPIKRSSRR